MINTKYLCSRNKYSLVIIPTFGYKGIRFFLNIHSWGKKVESYGIFKLRNLQKQRIVVFCSKNCSIHSSVYTCFVSFILADHQRVVSYTVLLVCVGVGTLCFIFLRNPRRPPPPQHNIVSITNFFIILIQIPAGP